MPGTCPCPTDYCEYDSDTVDELGGGDTIDKAADNAKRRARSKAEREAQTAMDRAMQRADVCEAPCEAWFKIRLGEPQAQEYPFHGDRRQFAIGWCEWVLLVKCEKPSPRAAEPTQPGPRRGRPR